jgi:predicted glycoside hydrolase/deacetylase ChbG (UPF0249 family)
MRRLSCLFAIASACAASVAQAADPTYAERLGWPAGTRALILHIDDAGMSYESNQGAIRSLADGVATSVSVMMPCPWVGPFVRWLVAQPQHDAGLHLTLTSEWADYRWGPLAGRGVVPGLVDREGSLWPTVAEVVEHANPDEVEVEIRAQLARARAMGFEPTHLDSHMGTLFANPAYLERYLEVGFDEGIPVMFPGGHATLIRRQNPAGVAAFSHYAQTIWDAGLPVLDDLHNDTYGWRPDEKAVRYVEAIRALQPGVTMMILHSSEASPTFDRITDSGPSRAADLDLMLDPRLAAVIAEEGIVLTTFRELKARRDRVGSG